MKTYVVELIGGPRDGEVFHRKGLAATIYFEEKHIDDAFILPGSQKYVNRSIRSLKYRQKHKLAGRYYYEFQGYA